jgi:uncharacterized protein (TIGR04222 family)
MSLGPFDLTGGPFLALYIFLLVVTVTGGLIIPHRLRPPGQTRHVRDVDELAYLAGGGARLEDAVVGRLLSARALVMIGKNRFSVKSPERAETPAERSVLALEAPIRWREIELALQSYIEPLEQRMITAGLLMTEEERGNVRFWSTLPYAMLITFGATKLIIGDARDRPIGYLTALVVLTVLFAVIRWFNIDRRTQAGRAAVVAARERSGRLRTAPTAPEIGMAVALFGTVVLAGSGWEDFHRLRNASGGGGGDGGSGGSDGGGGGCGGGCGGCGG